MRRVISLVILMSMMLHCAGRLDFLTYLYQNRHNIAFTIGLMEEKPIAVCSHEFDFNEEITIDYNSSESAPVHIPQAQEINLFFANAYPETLFLKNLSLIEVLRHCPYSETFCKNHFSEIFQPPKIS